MRDSGRGTRGEVTPEMASSKPSRCVSTDTLSP
jgi:hypothetical protein